MQRRTMRPASHLGSVQEVEELVIPEVPTNQQQERPQELTVEENLPPLEVFMSRGLSNVPEQQDLSEMLPLNLTIPHQEKYRKRDSVETAPAVPVKRLCCGDCQVVQQTSEAGRQSTFTVNQVVQKTSEAGRQSTFAVNQVVQRTLEAGRQSTFTVKQVVQRTSEAGRQSTFTVNQVVQRTSEAGRQSTFAVNRVVQRTSEAGRQSSVTEKEKHPSMAMDIDQEYVPNVQQMPRPRFLTPPDESRLRLILQEAGLADIPVPYTLDQFTFSEKEKHPSMAMDIDQEYVPNVQQMPRPRFLTPPDERRLTLILQEAGLADIPVEPPQITQTANIPVETPQITQTANIPVEPPQITQTAYIPIEPPQITQTTNIPVEPPQITQTANIPIEPPQITQTINIPVEPPQITQTTNIPVEPPQITQTINIPVEPPQITQTANIPVEPPQITQTINIPVEPPQITQTANIPVEPPQNQEAANIPARTRLTQESGNSESCLGTLNHTSVSLGDSNKTTDLAEFIKKCWSTSRTMIRIFRCFQQRKEQEAITVETVIAQKPILKQYRNIIKAKCFTNILELKRAGFIRVIKCPETLAIKDIVPGPRLENLTF